MAENNLTDRELRLEVLRLVKECGTEYQKQNPLPIAEEYVKWVNSKIIRKKNLTDKKE